jgi:hypothetical protein
MSPNEQKFDAMLTAALERQPEIAIPANFAARVAASVPAVRPAQRAVRVTHYGRTIATACTLLLMIALVLIPVLRPQFHVSLHNAAFALEMLLAFELAVLFAASEIWQLN